MLSPEETKKIDAEDLLLDKSDISAEKVQGSEIPSYVLYGEVYGSPFPDCLHCETIADRSRLHDWHIRPHRHYGLHQFIWITKGTVVATSDTSRQVLTAPAAIMNAPMAVHGFEFDPDTEGYVVTVPTVNLERSLPGPTTLISRLDHPIVLQCGDLEPRSGEASSIFVAIAKEFRNREKGRIEALLCQAGLLALWFFREADRQEPNNLRGERPHIALVRRFLALIEDNFRDHRPLSFYAHVLEVTTRHLTRECRRQFGLSAQAIIHDRLVLEAKRVLAYTPASIAHVAEDLGFRDPAYFTRFFTKHVGETPTSFRNMFINSD
jgi:AraC family transcriptional regulator, transcriptional activator of pobA